MTRREIPWPVSRYPWKLAAESPAIVSRHNDPQVSPQQFDCGCVTVCWATDRSALERQKPFEMRLVHWCGTDRCEIAAHFYATIAPIVRDLAVALVDFNCGGGGHTMEFCWDPASHADKYDEMEAFLKGEPW